MSDVIEVERRGPLLSVWLNRPGKRNALDGALLEAVAEVFTGVAVDYDVRTVVLGGRGISFCAGVDLGDPPGAARLDGGSGATDRERRRLSGLGARAVRAVKECDVPTVARIQGHAVGGGALLAAACDLRVMADDAVLSIPEVDLGIPLGWAGVPLLVSEVGAAHARELVMLGDRIGADDARRLGLAHRVVPAAELDDAVGDLAGRLAAKPEAAMAITKLQFRAYEHLSRLGDLAAADGDLLQHAIRAAGRFGR